VEAFGERGWLAGNDPHAMAWLIQSHYSVGEPVLGVPARRKVRLFACHCCRFVWSVLTDPEIRKAVDVAEAFADGIETVATLKALFKKVNAGAWGTGRHHHPYWLVNNAAGEKPYAWAVTAQLLGCCEHLPASRQTASDFMGRLLNDIFGNPFRPYPAPPSWPSTVVQLAEALYNGRDCRLPLSDALEEAGHPELAEHFRNEEHHPKGCSAMDLVLGKE